MNARRICALLLAATAGFAACSSPGAVGSAVNAVSATSLGALAAGTWSCQDAPGKATGTISVDGASWTLKATNSTEQPWTASGTWVMSGATLTVTVAKGSPYPGSPDGSVGTATGIPAQVSAGQTLTFTWDWNGVDESPLKWNAALDGKDKLVITRSDSTRTSTMTCSRQ